MDVEQQDVGDRSSQSPQGFVYGYVRADTTEPRGTADQGSQTLARATIVLDDSNGQRRVLSHVSLGVRLQSSLTSAVETRAWSCGSRDGRGASELRQSFQ